MFTTTTTKSSTCSRAITSSQFGGTEFAAGPGDLVFGPRGVPHAQRRLIPRTGRILAIFSPAGFEGFFRDLAEAARDGQVRPEEMNRIAAAYGLTWLV